MQVPTQNLRELLVEFQKEKQWGNDRLAAELTKYSDKSKPFSSTTVISFKKGHTAPHKNTVQSVTALLQDHGKLTRLGLPTDLGKPLEEKLPESIGFRDTRGDQELNAMQDDWISLKIVAAVMVAPSLTDTDRKAAVKAILPNKFSF